MPIDESGMRAMMLVGSNGECIPFDGLHNSELTIATSDDEVSRVPFEIPRNAGFTCRMKPRRMNRKRFVNGLVNSGWSRKAAKRAARRVCIPYGAAYWFYVLAGEDALNE